MTQSGDGGEGGGRRNPTTAPPPFDPEQYARDSELALRAAPAAGPSPGDRQSTKELPPAPPLNKRVRIGVPASDLAWFDLSEAALAMAARLDGTRTLHDLMEGGSPSALEAFAQLHDAGLVIYEE